MTWSHSKPDEDSAAVNHSGGAIKQVGSLGYACFSFLLHTLQMKEYLHSICAYIYCATTHPARSPAKTPTNCRPSEPLGRPEVHDAIPRLGLAAVELVCLHLEASGAPFQPTLKLWLSFLRVPLLNGCKRKPKGSQRGTTKQL